MFITKDNCKSLSDKEIISKSIEELDYFKCLYERYGNKLKRYITKISGFNADEADDILQNSFISIWKNINSYDDSLKLSSFIYRIVHNETISHWRKLKSKEKRNKQFGMNMYIEEDKNEDKIKRNFEVKEVLDKLSLKYKEVLVLKFLENMDYEEISNILKIPEGTVATRINRAKKAFVKIARSKNIKF